MAVKVEISSSLRRWVPDYDPSRGVLLEAEGLNVAQLVERLGLPAEEVRLVMVNRRAAGPDQVLADGDLVGLFPSLTGG